MMKKRTVYLLLLSICLILFAAGCKKKAPAPPPPPPPKAEVKPEPPKPSPVIASFTAEPTTIQKGQSSTLRWSTENVTEAAIDNGIGAVSASGQRQVYPTQTTTYTLSVRGPGGSTRQSATVNVTEPPAPPPPPPPVAKQSLTDIIQREVEDAFFDYDKSDIREDARAVLTRDADVLKRIFADSTYAGQTVTIEGHCDERGSAEYNLGLGDRRSTAARDFLVQLGVPADRLKTVSYGKERQQCTEANEGCWQKNRRAHFSAQ